MRFNQVALTVFPIEAHLSPYVGSVFAGMLSTRLGLSTMRTSKRILWAFIKAMPTGASVSALLNKERGLWVRWIIFLKADGQPIQPQV